MGKVFWVVSNYDTNHYALGKKIKQIESTGSLQTSEDQLQFSIIGSDKRWASFLATLSKGYDEVLCRVLVKKKMVNEESEDIRELRFVSFFSIVFSTFIKQKKCLHKLFSERAKAAKAN